MNIVILDDYQDAVRKLACAVKLEAYSAKVYTNTVKGTGQLAVRLKDADVIVLIRERTHLTRQVLEKLPRLKLIAQTGRIGSHVDVAACTERGIAVAEGTGSPIAPAELTWALVMAAMRRIPQYVSHLKHGAWQQSGLKSASMPSNFGLGSVLKGKTLGIWSYGKTGQLVVQELLAKGHSVRAFLRDPAKLPLRDEKLHVIAGDARDAAAVDAAVEGAEAVISTLGASRKDKDPVFSAGTKSILAAMSRHDCLPIAVISAQGVGTEGDTDSSWSDRALGTAQRNASAAIAVTLANLVDTSAVPFVLLASVLIPLILLSTAKRLGARVQPSSGGLCPEVSVSSPPG